MGWIVNLTQEEFSQMQDLNKACYGGDGFNEELWLQGLTEMGIYPFPEGVFAPLTAVVSKKDVISPEERFTFVKDDAKNPLKK